MRRKRGLRLNLLVSLVLSEPAVQSVLLTVAIVFQGVFEGSDSALLHGGEHVRGGVHGHRKGQVLEHLETT